MNEECFISENLPNENFVGLIKFANNADVYLFEKRRVVPSRDNWE